MSETTPADPEPDEEQPVEDEADDDGHEPPKKKGSPKHPDRPARQAARYRVERNEARRARDSLTVERDALAEQRNALLFELAFTRAAGTQFENLDAAWALADKSNFDIDYDGAIIGAVEAVEAVAEAHPFIVCADDEEPAKKELDPFLKSSGRMMNGKRKPMNQVASRAVLEAKYPALRRGR